MLWVVPLRLACRIVDNVIDSGCCEANVKNLVVIGGTMGVGKSTTCRELLNQLDKVVWLDGDWCWMMHPWQVTTETRAMVERNIIVLLRNFLSCSAYDTVLFDWVLDRQSTAAAILTGLRDLEFHLTSVSLTCSPEELQKRLAQDGRAPSVITDAIDRLPRYRDLPGSLLDTTGLPVSRVADRVQELMRDGTNRREQASNS